jgi:hypothetical protein
MCSVSKFNFAANYYSDIPNLEEKKKDTVAKDRKFSSYL